MIIASTKKSSIVVPGSPLRFFTHFIDTRNALNVINDHCQFFGHVHNLYVQHLRTLYPPDRAKPYNIYPNRYLGQYLTCVRLGAVPAWTFAFARGGLGGGGGGAFLLSLLLSVMVKPRSPLSCRLTLGKKWVETCWDLTRGLEPILAFPLLLRATNHSRPVLWFLWITEA